MGLTFEAWQNRDDSIKMTLSNQNTDVISQELNNRLA